MRELKSTLKNLTNFFFNRVRANGKELSNDYKNRRLKVNYIN